MHFPTVPFINVWYQGAVVTTTAATTYLGWLDQLDKLN